MRCLIVKSTVLRSQGIVIEVFCDVVFATDHGSGGDSSVKNSLLGDIGISHKGNLASSSKAKGDFLQGAPHGPILARIER